MKVPKYIRDKMHRIATLHAQAIELTREVDIWLIEHGINLDDISDGNGYSLEELDYGNDVTDELCMRLESM